ncbi:MAG: hypothetical protein KBT88_09260 [Gammaproteobacteria bacterium]|nr:hypothetical protein [Gammaproteobacteria bacterium]MBQ0839964.1 hypothetical protein [Gammaproteobacteria bacterium]
MPKDNNQLLNDLLKIRLNLEKLVNAVLHKHKKGKAERISNVAIAKAGAVATGLGISATVGTVGTALTGTAISTLHGAAATSATLAWIGGTVAAGTVIITAASLAGGLGLMLGTGYLTKKILMGKAKEYEALNELEKKIIDSASALALALDYKMDLNDPAFVPSVSVLYKEALSPLLANVYAYQEQVDALPFFQRLRYQKATKKLAESVRRVGRSVANNKAAAATGVVMGVFFKFIANPDLEFEGDQLLVIEAMRKQYPKLIGDKPIDEISEIVNSKYSFLSGNDESIRGFINGVQGKYLELKIIQSPPSFLERYNLNIFNKQNEEAVDISAYDPITGNREFFQVKALNPEGRMSGLGTHFSKNPEVPVLGTSDMADKRSDILDSGITHSDITGTTSDVVDDLQKYADMDIVGPFAFGALPIVALAVKSRLEGKQNSGISSDNLKTLLEAAAVSSGMSVPISLLLG